MTYCIGVMLDQGIVFASDSRTNAGMDNIAKFCKMTLFERRGDRVIVLSELRQPRRHPSGDRRAEPALCRRRRGLQPLARADDVRRRDAGRRRDARHRTTRRSIPAGERGRFNASFIVGGQISGEAVRLFRIYAEGNFIEAEEATPYFQTGETKYGKPIIDRVITRHTPLSDAAKCVLVSFDLTMRSNLSVGMPIDLICYERDSLEVRMRRRFDAGDTYFTALSHDWSEGTRNVFRHLPELGW